MKNITNNSIMANTMRIMTYNQNSNDTTNVVKAHSTNQWASFITSCIFDIEFKYDIPFCYLDSELKNNKSSDHIPGYYYIRETVLKTVRKVKTDYLLRKK